jgi:rhamnogalacturonyl hydrolase YesR
MSAKRDLLESSLHKVEKWIEEHNYRGYEPFDGLSSFLRPLTFGNLFLDRILMQIVRQSPINLRPVLGIKPLESTKGRGYMASGYLTMYKKTGDETYKTRALDCLEWLMKNKSPKFEQYSWANHFDFAGRGGMYAKHESIIVWTSLIGQAFLDAYELFGDTRYLQVAESACRWALSLPIVETSSGICLGYTALWKSVIHNSSMLGAALLARTGALTNNTEFIKVAKEAMYYSCSRQNPDGSWYYGDHPMFLWIDNFHTGYNLNSLKCYIESTGDKAYEDNVRRGLEFFKNNFFEPTGRPKYYHSRTYPVDSQCASQAIDTLVYFSDWDGQSLDLAIKVAGWWIENMQDRDGFFYYRQYPLGIKAKTPMLHWAEATMYKALACLVLKMG